jgi:dimethylglycine dehydrogenase
MSVSFSGELAYELHVPNEQLYLVWQLLQSAEKDFGLSKFGLYATESMRLEKGYLHWKAEIIDEFTPFEAGLDRFISMDKEFVGKTALQQAQAQGPRKLLVSLEIDSDVAPAHSGDPVFNQGQQVGVVTSAGYGHRVGKNLAYAYVDPVVAVIGQHLSVTVTGKVCLARVVPRCQYDPNNLLVRN